MTGGDPINLSHYGSLIPARSMRIVTAALCLALAGFVSADEPAIAESPYRLFTVACIELNHWTEDREVPTADLPDENSEPAPPLPCTRFCFWGWRWLPVSNRWTFISFGACDAWQSRLYMSPGLYAVEFGDVRVEAPEMIVTTSNVNTTEIAEHREILW